MNTFLRLSQESYGLVQSSLDVPAAVRVGDERRRRFHPELAFSKWEGKAYLRINHGRSPPGRLHARGAELRGSCGGYTHLYRRLDGERFEFDTILSEKPRDGKVVYEIDFPRGLEFHRQPEDSPRGGRCRPDVPGSYAVYWRERNNRYKTGKFCHIFRPEIIDRGGRRVWGELEIEPNRGLLTVRIPRRWLAEAALPITVDPVIGTSSVGEYLGEFVMEEAMSANRYQVAQTLGGLCTGYLYGCMDVNQNVMLAVYSDNNGTPLTLRSNAHSNVNPYSVSGAWFSGTFIISEPFSAGQYLWIAAFPAPSEFLYYPTFDIVSNAEKYMVTNYVSSPPGAWVNAGTWMNLYSMYFDFPEGDQAYVRNLQTSSAPAAAAERNTASVRKKTESEAAGDTAGRRLIFPRVARNLASCVTPALRKIGFHRQAESAELPSDYAVRKSDYRRSAVETTDPGTWLSGVIPIFRAAADSLNPRTLLRRGIGLAARILEAFGVWDYLLHRYPVATERLFLRSRITREFRFKSRIAE